MSSIDVQVCQCPLCRVGDDHSDRRLHEQMTLLLSRLDEAERRWYAVVEVNRLGHGGARLVAQITGLDEKTIRPSKARVGNVFFDGPLAPR
jgi:hypothetical protein